MKKSAKRGYDVVVIGGGSVGINTAHQLDRAGAKVLLVSSGELGGQYRKSREQYRMGHSNKVHNWMVDQTLGEFDRLADEHGVITRIERPYIFLVGQPNKSRPERRTIEDYHALDKRIQGWGFNPRMEFLDAEAVRERYPLVDGREITGAAVIKNAGRLFLNTAANAMAAESRDTTVVRGHAEEIIFDSANQVTGVKIDGGIIPTKKVVVAPGAFVTQMQDLIPNVDLTDVINRFTVTQRELYTGPVPTGLPLQEDTFLIFPDHANVVFNAEKRKASYEYQFPDEPHVASPKENPTDDINRRRRHPHSGSEMPVSEIIFDLLSPAISQYGNTELYPSFQFNRATAGYFTRYSDAGPVIDFVPGVEGVVLAGAGDVSGIQTGTGFGKMAAALVLGTTLTSPGLLEAVRLERDPSHFPDFAI